MQPRNKFFTEKQGSQFGTEKNLLWEVSARQNCESFRDVGGLHAASCAANRKILACCGREGEIFYWKNLCFGTVKNFLLRVCAC